MNMQNEEVLITLKLTQNEANTVIAGLGKLPWEQVFQLINKILGEAANQLNPQKSTSKAKEAQ